MWHINTKISARQTSAKGSVSSHFVTSCLPGEIFTRHCASTVKHGIFNTHIRISRFLVSTSFEDHIKISPSQIRDPKSPVGSLRGNFLVCRTCPFSIVCPNVAGQAAFCHALAWRNMEVAEFELPVPCQNKCNGLSWNEGAHRSHVPRVYELVHIGHTGTEHCHDLLLCVLNQGGKGKERNSIEP